MNAKQIWESENGGNKPQFTVQDEKIRTRITLFRSSNKSASQAAPLVLKKQHLSFQRVRATTVGALVVPYRSTALTAMASGALEKVNVAEPPGTTFTSRHACP